MAEKSSIENLLQVTPYGSKDEDRHLLEDNDNIENDVQAEGGAFSFLVSILPWFVVFWFDEVSICRDTDAGSFFETV